ELRLAGISSIAAANAFVLPTFGGAARLLAEPMLWPIRSSSEKTALTPWRSTQDRRSAGPVTPPIPPAGYHRGIGQAGSCPADEQCSRLFEVTLDALNEGGRLPAVDDAVIERRREVHHLADDHLAAADHRPLGDAVDADDGYFGAVDDRRARHAAEPAEAG